MTQQLLPENPEKAQQHVVGRNVGQATGERALHELQAVVQVVLERAGEGLVEADRATDRLLGGVELLLVAAHAVADLLRRQGNGCHRAAA